MDQTSQTEGADEMELPPVVDQPHDPAVRRRIDPRTGKMLMLRDASFWREHDAERRRRGQSIVEYCQAHGLALSTFRRWATQFNRESRDRQALVAAGSDVASFLAVPIRSDASAVGQAAVEVVLSHDVSVKLGGEAAARVIETVFSRLAGAR